jgi:hypothetical protein
LCTDTTGRHARVSRHWKAEAEHVTQIPDTRNLWKRLEEAGWPTLMVRGSAIGGSETVWSRHFPYLSYSGLDDVHQGLRSIEGPKERYREWLTAYDYRLEQERQAARAFERNRLRQTLRDDSDW